MILLKMSNYPVLKADSQYQENEKNIYSIQQFNTIKISSCFQVVFLSNNHNNKLFL